jgi:hypothetical protein
MIEALHYHDWFSANPETELRQNGTAVDRYTRLRTSLASYIVAWETLVCLASSNSIASTSIASTLVCLAILNQKGSNANE